MQYWLEALLSPGKALMVKVISSLPHLLAAILILIGGWILPRLLKLVAIKFLFTIRFDLATERAGLDDLFRRGGIRQSPVERIGELVYWMLLLVFFMAMVNALGLQAASSLLNHLLLFFPRLFAAVFILVLGLFLANLFSGLIRSGMERWEWQRGDLWGRVGPYGIIVVAFARAWEQLDIAPQIVTAAFTILFGSTFLALSSAVGLGCKDLVGKLSS